MLFALKKWMDSMRIPWMVCGGTAIDLFIGEQTRPHKDVDVAVFWENREQIIGEFLDRGWRVFEPDHGLLREITSFEEDMRVEDNLWCLHPAMDSYLISNRYENYYSITTERENQDVLDYIEVLFNQKKDGAFLYKRNPGITLKPYIYYDNSGIPYLAPEMVLLYKSIFIRLLQRPKYMEMVNNYRHDFQVVLERLSFQQQKWLRDALRKEYPEGHEWIAQLEAFFKK